VCLVLWRPACADTTEPLHPDWEREYSDAHSDYYFYNVFTRETSWTKPIIQVWRRWKPNWMQAEGGGRALGYSDGACCCRGTRRLFLPPLQPLAARVLQRKDYLGLQCAKDGQAMSLEAAIEAMKVRRAWAHRSWERDLSKLLVCCVFVCVCLFVVCLFVVCLFVVCLRAYVNVAWLRPGRCSQGEAQVDFRGFGKAAACQVQSQGKQTLGNATSSSDGWRVLSWDIVPRAAGMVGRQGK
jgi:hypothetical protein